MVGGHKLKKRVFTVEHMKRWSWATTYEKEIRKIPGVTGAVADLETMCLAVEYDEGAVSPEMIKKTIRDVGSRFLNQGFTRK